MGRSVDNDNSLLCGIKRVNAIKLSLKSSLVFQTISHKIKKQGQACHQSMTLASFFLDIVVVS